MTPDHRAARWVALVATTLAGFLTPFMDSAATVALPTISRQFSMDAISLSWIRTAYLLSAAVFLVPFGKVADSHGRKRVFIWGAALFTLAAVVIGLSTSGAMLIATRAIQGLGSAMLFGTSVAILTSAFPPAQRGRVLGLNVAAVYLGLSLGPTLGGVLTGALGWRSIFFTTAFLGLSVLALSALWLKGEWVGEAGERFDLLGSAAYSLSLVALMYGFASLPGIRGWGLLGLGAVGLTVFVGLEMRARNPVLNLELFARSRAFSFSNLAALVNYSATSAVTFLLSLYLQYILGLSPARAGIVLVFQPIVQAAVSPLAGWLSDRIEPRIVASVGMACTALGLFLLVFVGPESSLWTIEARLALMGLGFGLFSSPNMSAIMGSVSSQSYGVASSILATMRLVGQMLSMGIAMLLFTLFMGRTQITPEVYSGFMASTRTAFAIFAALCAVGIFASLARGALREEHDTKSRKAPYASASDR